MNKKILFGAIAILVLVGVFFIFNQSGKSIEEINKDIGGALNEQLGMLVPGTNTDEMIEQPTSNIKEFDIIAKQWEFSPSTINVNFGDTVILNVESVDVNHGIAIPTFNVDEKLIPEKKTRIEFIATKKGTFSFFCNVLCGGGHYDMDGKIIVN